MQYKSSYKWDYFRLDNGLKVVLIKKDDAPLIGINLTYKVGSKDENPKHTGFAHLFEHLMFEGTFNIPKGEFDKICSKAGGTNNAYTSYDQTSYTMYLPSNQLELGLWLESDRMFNSFITTEALNNQKNVVVEEIKQTVENEPYGKWREVLAASAFSPECSYSWEVHGSKEHVAQSTIEDTMNFFKLFYRPDNACLVISGKIDFTEATALIKKYFEKSKPGPEIKRNIFIPEYLKKGIIAESIDNVPLSAVFVSCHYDGFLSKEYFTGDIIANILGDGKSSRLYNSLVLNKKTASSIGAFNDKREFSSLLTIYAVAATPDINCQTLEEDLKEILAELINNGIKVNEHTKAVNQLRTQITNDLQSNYGIADQAAGQAIFFDDPGRTFILPDFYNSVTNGDLKKFISTRLKTEDTIIVNVFDK